MSKSVTSLFKKQHTQVIWRSDVFHFTQEHGLCFLRPLFKGSRPTSLQSLSILQYLVAPDWNSSILYSLEIGFELVRTISPDGIGLL